MPTKKEFMQNMIDKGITDKGTVAKFLRRAESEGLIEDDPISPELQQKQSEIQSNMDKELSGIRRKQGVLGGLSTIATGLGGFAEGATFGAANLIPGFKRGLETGKEEAPGGKAAAIVGEVGSFLTPGSLAKGVTKGVQKTIGKGVGRKIAGEAIAAGSEEGAKTLSRQVDVDEAIETGKVGEAFDEIDIGDAAKQAGAGTVLTGGLGALGSGGRAALRNLKGRTESIADAATKQGFGRGMNQSTAPRDVTADDLLSDIKEFGLPEPTAKLAPAAAKQADAVMKEIDNAFAEAAKNKITFSVDDILLKAYDDAPKAKVGEAVPVESIIKKIDQQIKNLTDRGLMPPGGKELDANKMRKIKEIVGRIAFDKNKFDVPEKSADIAANKIIWKNLITSMDEKIPGLSDLGNKASRLFTLKDVSELALEKSGKSSQGLSVQISTLGALAAAFNPFMAIARFGAVQGAKEASQLGRSVPALKTVGGVAGQLADGGLPRAVQRTAGTTGVQFAEESDIVEDKKQLRKRRLENAGN
jgi:hypothetical protein